MTETPPSESDVEARNAIVEALNSTPPYAPFPSFQDFVTPEYDPTTMRAFLKILQEAKSTASPEQMSAAVDRATKWAAVDTGAIEGLYEVERGFTFSVAAGAAAWDNLHLQVGDDAGRAIRDALAAYEFVLDAATEARPITESLIKNIHSVICASQETYSVLTALGMQNHALVKGDYKTIPNNPYSPSAERVHAYAPVFDTAPEMARLVAELNTFDFLAADPVIQAAYSHYAYVCVHPFADGNGRVARALASIFLYRAPGVPLVIFADQKPGYIDALELADVQQYDPFVKFVAERAIDVVRMVADDMRRPVRESVEQRLARMRESLLGRGGLPHEEVDALGALLADQLQEAANHAVGKSGLAYPLSAQVSLAAGMLGNIVENYRHSPDQRIVQLHLESAAPASARTTYSYAVLIAKGTEDRADFVVVRTNGEVLAEVLMRDLRPTVNPALTYRLNAAMEEALDFGIDATIAAGEESLRGAGYR